MERVGEFSKVSFEQFYKDIKDVFGEMFLPYLPEPDGSKNTPENAVRKIYDAIELPSRATGGSAGYDFKAPFYMNIAPGETLKVPTGIRVEVKEGWWLGCLPRSGLGFKYRMQLDNTMGVIDSDYYYSDNEGHIFIKVTNDSRDKRSISVNAGESFVQGIFIPYGITYSDDAKAVRNGGMGSTDGK